MQSWSSFGMSVDLPPYSLLRRIHEQTTGQQLARYICWVVAQLDQQIAHIDPWSWLQYNMLISSNFKFSRSVTIQNMAILPQLHVTTKLAKKL